jgi:hypothetical protein
MKFLREKFYDEKGIITHFLSDNTLLDLEKSEDITKELKKEFVEEFLKKIVEAKFISQETIGVVKTKYPANSWSIDFPGWIGSFDEQKGKKVMVIGSEPHIHFEYLQTVYAFNNSKQASDFIDNDHPIFRFLSAILTDRFKLSREEVLKECYLTDLFPLAPFRGNGVSVGSVDKIQLLLSGANWLSIRSAFARNGLPKEIEGVKPELIVTQGVTVLGEVMNILGIKSGMTAVPIVPVKGKRQFIRKVEWNGIPIISVPHIGSSRMRTFWNNNIKQIKKVVSEI